ncbi:hypothetical protein GCM10022261_00520 [Brevibacterium daeguense]|uniref:DUF5134 domain-containing protein n=2 Tax=Brevibacterium daeguense TaxID=909936 RepID=A0ABP8EEY2_9MICO
MFAGMIDLAFLAALSPVWWMFLLILGGLLLSVDLRMPQNQCTEVITGRNDLVLPCRPLRRDGALRRPVMVSVALAYPAMAWLALSHDHGTHGSTGGSAEFHAGSHSQHGTDLLMLVLPLGTILLITSLAVLACVSLWRCRLLLSVEAGAMSAMLVVMLFTIVEV